jgi:hypothetical protein
MNRYGAATVRERSQAPMKEWLRRTHGPFTELLRHFLLRFFDSDLITTPGQMAGPLIGVFSLLLPWFNMFIGMLRHKYAYFGGLSTPGPFRHVVRADELWLVTLMMSAIGLATAVKWESVFPSLRDYRSLGTLPLRPWQIFAAKLAALLVVITATIVVLNFLPAIGFPAVSSTRWQFGHGVGMRVLAHIVACVSGCYFFFFGLVALQGVFLNLLPPRAFGQVAGWLQGLLVAVMLVLIVLSFSIDAGVADRVLQPQWARWLPPVWFLGIYQAMLGDPDPPMQMLAHRAWMALAIAMALALLTYLISYQRHRELLVEGATRASRDRRWTGALLRLLVPDSRQQAVTVFMFKTLARSSHHRMILMAYGGCGFAILMSGIVGVRAAVAPDRVAAATFIYAHVVFLAFLLIGLRHLFAIPAELRANWLFQITEREGRADWLRAVDRFVLMNGLAVMLLAPLPLELKLVGWHAVVEVALCGGFALLCYEWAFSGWEKLPFTCSHLPGKTPMWIRFLQFLGLLGALPAVNYILLSAVYYPTVFLVVMIVQLLVWKRIHAAREDGWAEQRLKYDETPDQAIHALNLHS